VEHLEVPYTDEERLAHRNLQQYSELRLRSASSEGERLAAEFVLKLLKKRLFSSPAAFGTTLEKHMNTTAGQTGTVNYARDIAAYEDDYADDEEYETQIGEAVGSASQTLSLGSIEERSLLEQLSEAITNANSPSLSPMNLTIPIGKQILD
jgi:hypothetical protein